MQCKTQTFVVSDLVSTRIRSRVREFVEISSRCNSYMHNLFKSPLSRRTQTVAEVPHPSEPLGRVNYWTELSEIQDQPNLRYVTLPDNALTVSQYRKAYANSEKRWGRWILNYLCISSSEVWKIIVRTCFLKRLLVVKGMKRIHDSRS